MEDKLKPCPFCGKKPIIFEGIALPKELPMYKVFCDDADCVHKPSASFYPALHAAIDDWNWRVNGNE